MIISVFHTFVPFILKGVLASVYLSDKFITYKKPTITSGADLNVARRPIDIVE